MKKVLITLILVAIFAALVNSLVLAQLPQCTITGVIYLPSGAVASNVRVTVVKVVKSGQIVSLTPVSYTSNSLGVVTLIVARDSTAYLYANAVSLNTNGSSGTPVVVPNSATANLEDLVSVSAVASTGVVVKDEGTALTNLVGTLNFVGAGISAVQASAGVATITVSSTGGNMATDTLWNAAGDLAVGTGADTATRLGIGTASQVLRVNAGATALEWATLAGGGNALTTDPLSQFAATTSAQLKGVLSDELGDASGKAIFALGTLSIASGKTATFSNTLTFTGTDGSTLNVGTGGTLGTNAYTSTAYAPVADPTFTGTVTIPTPFTLGAVSVTPTGTELNFVDGVTSGIQGQLDGKQPLDTDLTAIAGLTSAADKGIYFTGAGTAGVYDLTSAARTVLDDASVSAMRTTLGVAIGTDVQAQDAELAAIAGLTSAADSLPYFTGSGTASLATFTSFGRSLVDDANAGAARTTLGVAIGSDVQAFNAILLDLAGLTQASDKLPYFDSSTTAATTDLSSFGRSLIDDADASAGRTTLGLGTLATQSGTFSGTSSGTNTGDQTITLTGNVTGSGTGSFATTIANTAVTNAMLAGSIAISKLSITGTPDGSKFLRDDGSWQAIPGGGDALVANPLSQFASTTSAQLAGVISNETGSGVLVFATTPTLVTPVLGAATGTSLALGADPADAGVVMLENAAVIGWEAAPAGTDVTLTVNSSEQFVFSAAILSPALVTPDLGTPSAATLTNATGLPISTGVSGLGSGVATFLATPSSANLASAVTGETGSGALVFGTSPDFTTGVTLGGVAIPTISSTDTLSNKTLTAPKFADLGFIADANGNELIVMDTVASAVNEHRFANAATGGSPTWFANGGDTDIDLTLTPKGAGDVVINGTSWSVDASGNITTTGSISSGVGGSEAGAVELTEGTAPALVANAFSIYAPTDVAAGGLAYVTPGTAATGAMRATNVGGVMTITHDTGISHLAASTSADLAGVLSDELGSAGGFVRGTGATLTDAIAATSFQLPNGTAPTTNADGEVAFDTNIWAAGRGSLQIWDGTANTIAVNVLASDAPSNGQVPVWNTGGTITWETQSGGGGATTALDNLASVAINTSLISDTNNTDDLGSASVMWRSAYIGTSLFLANNGLKIADTNASHNLIIVAGSNITADRNFTITTGDAARTLDLSGGNLTLAGAFTTSGANALTFTTTGTTGVTLPTSGTLATTAQLPLQYISMLNSQTVPDASGNVFFEPYSIRASNDFWRHIVGIFNDTATDDALYGKFELNQACASGATVTMVWTTDTATSGVARFTFSYRVITADDTNSLDQATSVEDVTITDTAPGAINRRMSVTFTPTNSNFSTAGTVEWKLIRTGTSGSDTLADQVILHDLKFSCTP